MLNRIIFLSFLIFMASPYEAYAGTFGAESFTLENGMQVVVIPNHRAPVVTHSVWYKVGAADEDFGHSGVAHFLEHLMFKGTEKIGPGEFSRIITSIGGNDNAFTSQDYTAFYQSVSKSNLEKVMKMEADRMTNLALPSKEVESELQVILEERRQVTDNDPSSRLGEQMRAALFVNHPYGIPVIGWMHEMKQLNRDAVYNFYKKWYSPSNAILVISGDITAEELRPVAKKIYGKIPAGAAPERYRTTIPDLHSDKKILYRHEHVRQPIFQRVVLAPGFRENKEESLALEVLSEAVSGGPTTRLYKHLATEKKIATNVGMYYRSDAWDYGEIGIYGVPNSEITLDDMEDGILSEIRDIAKNGITEEELKLAKKRLKAAAIYARDSLKGPAMTVGRALVTGSSLEDIENWPNMIGKVSLEQVNQVAAKYLDPDNGKASVTGYLLPESPTETEKNGEGNE